MRLSWCPLLPAAVLVAALPLAAGAAGADPLAQHAPLMAPAGAEAAVEDAQVAAIFAALGAQPRRSATFVERRSSALFKAPQLATGVLRFRAPAWLEKETLSPRHERLRIDGDRVSWELSDQRNPGNDVLAAERGAAPGSGAIRSIAIDADPRLAALVTGLRATLAGDLPGVERHFAVTLAAAADRWRLTLLPRDPLVEKSLIRIELEGRAGDLLRVAVIEADGDRSEMTITPAAPIE
jgi:hypothetical protein